MKPSQNRKRASSPCETDDQQAEARRPAKRSRKPKKTDPLTLEEREDTNQLITATLVASRVREGPTVPLWARLPAGDNDPQCKLTNEEFLGAASTVLQSKKRQYHVS